MVPVVPVAAAVAAVEVLVVLEVVAIANTTCHLQSTTVSTTRGSEQGDLTQG